MRRLNVEVNLYDWNKLDNNFSCSYENSFCWYCPMKQQQTNWVHTDLKTMTKHELFYIFSSLHSYVTYCSVRWYHTTNYVWFYLIWLMLFVIMMYIKVNDFFFAILQKLTLKIPLKNNFKNNKMSVKTENKITLRIEALSNRKEINIGNPRKCSCSRFNFLVIFKSKN